LADKQIKTTCATLYWHTYPKL